MSQSTKAQVALTSTLVFVAAAILLRYVVFAKVLDLDADAGFNPPTFVLQAVFSVAFTVAFGCALAALAFTLWFSRRSLKAWGKYCLKPVRAVLGPIATTLGYKTGG